MKENKVIVCDIDDTLSFTFNRDFDNAKPNLPLIKKLNDLYDQGWTINLYTARGSLSCSNREEAKQKYFGSISNWLNRNGVKYHELSFNKPLATYYIDDKGIKPEEFLNLHIEDFSGMSGATITRTNEFVYKTADNSLEAVEWYEKFTQPYSFKLPKIHSIVGKTIKMDYIDGFPLRDFKITKEKIDNLLQIIGEVSYTPIELETKNQFDSYLSRINDHLSLNHSVDKKIIQLLKNFKDQYQLNTSFSHGDFSLDNIIIKKENNKETFYLIDPIYIKDVWSSYLLDNAKLAHSLRKYGETEALKYLYSKMKDKDLVYLLEITQWIRILKYTKSISLRVEYTNIVNDLIKGY